MKKTFETDVIEKTHRVIETEPIEDTDFAYYKDIRHIDIDGKKRTEIYQGITSKANLEAVHGLEHIKSMVSAPNMYEEEAIVAAIPKKELESMKKGICILGRIETVAGKSYPIPEDYQLILFNSCSMEISDLHYNIIPQPIDFDSVLVGNDIYDLDKLLERLKEDEHVIGREKLKITHIPSYTAYDNHTQTIHFSYLPDAEIYQKLSPMATFYKKQYILKNLIKADDFLVEREENEEDLEWL